jgi:hypothetical protein
MPIIETLRTAFGGVQEALMSGDWELAGNIAMTGLRLAVMQGLSAIQKAFPETFNTVLRVFAKIGDGIVMVWNKVTGFLTDQWNNWGKQTLGTVLGVMGRIPEIWRETVEGMANWMLKTSAAGGVMGKAMSAILGVDMAEEQARSNRLDKQLGLEPTDVLADARVAVGQYLDSLTSGAGEAGTGSMAEGLEQFLAKLESGAGLDDLAKELAALRGEAAKQRTEASTGGAGGAAAGGGLLGAAVPRGVGLTATYSASAARISGYQPGGGPEKKMADGITAIEKNTKEMTALQQQFLAGWRVA